MQQNWHEPGVLRPEPRPLERVVASEAHWKARLWETLKDQDPWGCAACRATKTKTEKGPMHAPLTHQASGNYSYFKHGSAGERICDYHLIIMTYEEMMMDVGCCVPNLGLSARDERCIRCIIWRVPAGERHIGDLDSFFTSRFS